MWQFFFGIGIGIYIGTYYNCAPSIMFITRKLKENIPDEALPKER